MLSAKACSQRTLQAMAGMFEKAVVGAGQLPVVGKLHDDAMLRPPNDAIGERPCVNADLRAASHSSSRSCATAPERGTRSR